MPLELLRRRAVRLLLIPRVPDRHLRAGRPLRLRLPQGGRMLALIGGLVLVALPYLGWFVLTRKPVLRLLAYVDSFLAR